MREYEMEVLEKYDLEVKSTRRIRGAFFCDTKEGTMLLKETKISKRRAPLLYLILNRLESQGKKVDLPVFSRDGELIQNSRDGTGYIMKKWYAGEECNLKKEEEIYRAARTLGELHQVFEWREPEEREKKMFQKKNLEEIQEAEEQEIDWTRLYPLVSRNPEEELLRHNREMKKVRAFIRKRVGKNEFEAYYLKHYEEVSQLAESVTRQMQELGCQNLYQKSIQNGKLVHGDYNYHNVLILENDQVITNFERMKIGIQADDLYYFLRKVMEKYHWKQKIGQNILEAYEDVRKLDAKEREYIRLRLTYPEKFWKTASAYSRSNKVCLPEKSVEKLQIAVEQKQEKDLFLNTVFVPGKSCQSQVL